MIVLAEKEGQHDRIDLRFDRLNRNRPSNSADERRACTDELGGPDCCRPHGKKESDDRTPEDFEDCFSNESSPDPVRATRMKEAEQPAETARDRG
ncbi:MAG TPA: hypothetical protein VN641_02670 [Urbifossiella sp.]|nr:hypothetical protein [Urbifossiella sp.]